MSSWLESHCSLCLFLCRSLTTRDLPCLYSVGHTLTAVTMYYILAITKLIKKTNTAEWLVSYLSEMAHREQTAHNTLLSLPHWQYPGIMMTSSNGNNFRVTIPLWGESTGEGIHRWPVDSPHKGQWRGALTSSWSAPEQTAEQTIETPVVETPHLAHYDATVMVRTNVSL